MAVTSQQEAKLQTLSPNLRDKVEARLGSGQTVDEVLETMLLNEISSLYADARYYRFDRDAATITVVYGPGQEEVTVRYDPVTWVILQ